MRFLIAASLMLASCSSAAEEPTATQPSVESASPTTAGSEPENDAEQQFPDVVGADATQDESGSWTFAVTLSSPYDTPDRYADSWRVRGSDGTVYGERFLTHDHANEQPFTRSQSGIEIPDTVDEVIIEGRDQVNGWGGTTLTFTLDRS
ncbi:MAG: hypothetical protein ACN4GZ_00940 [Acidimicrobiales bacterium]